MRVSNKRVMRRVTLRHLQKNKKYTVFTLFAIILATAMVTATVGFASSGRKMIFDIKGEDIFDLNQYVSMVYTLAAIFGTIIVITSIIIASNAFRVSADERSREFGLLKTLGATSKQIRSSVIYEGVVLCLIGIPIGLILGNAIDYFTCHIVDTYIETIRQSMGGNPRAQNFHFSYVFSWQGNVIGAAISFITVIISAWLPSRKIAKVSAIEGLKQTGAAVKKKNLKKLKKAKMPILMGKFFGYEGKLASKQVKRSGRSFRATILALTIGIVLFMISSYFVDGMSQVVDDPDESYTNSINFTSTSQKTRLNRSERQKIANMLSKFEGNKVLIEVVAKDPNQIDDSQRIMWDTSVSNPEKFREYAGKVLSEYLHLKHLKNNKYIYIGDGMSFSSIDLTEGYKVQLAVVKIVRLFTYGFSGLLTLIVVTSMISTILTNIRLRTREFALYRSIGMADANLTKLLNCESVFTAIRALIFGISLGSLAIFGMYKGFIQTEIVPFHYPWMAALISIIGVFVIILGVTKIAKRRIDKLSVMEAIREE